MKKYLQFINETTVIDYIGDEIDQKDAVWCEYDKDWCLRKDAEWIDYLGIYTHSDNIEMILRKKEERKIKEEKRKKLNLLHIDVDPYCEEIWDDEINEGEIYHIPQPRPNVHIIDNNGEEMVRDWLGDIIPIKDAVWCEYDKEWCLKKDIWIQYKGFYTTPDVGWSGSSSDAWKSKGKETYDEEDIQWFENMNEGYSDYNKRLEYKISKSINIQFLRADEVLEELKKNFIGNLIISPEYDEYILHIVDWRKVNGNIEFVYDGYYSDSVKNCLNQQASINLGRNTKIYFIDGDPEYVIVGRRVNEVDPLGEENWDDDKELN
jgi:hypothetical protein